MGGLAACNQSWPQNDVLALNEACGRLFEQLQALTGRNRRSAGTSNSAEAIQQLSGGDTRAGSPEVYELLTPSRPGSRGSDAGSRGRGASA